MIFTHGSSAGAFEGRVESLSAGAHVLGLCSANDRACLLLLLGIVGTVFSVLRVLLGVQAHVRYIDALYASGRFEEAAVALQKAVASDATFRAIPEYKVGAVLWQLQVWLVVWQLPLYTRC